MIHDNLQKADAIGTAIKHWKYIAPIVHEPENQKDYEQLSVLLDHLLDIVGEDETHELIGLIDVISHMISLYDEREHDVEPSSGIDALKFLMTAHHLKQTDLADIASQGVISEILSGKRNLNLNQIKKLAVKFKVTADTFID